MKPTNLAYCLVCILALILQITACAADSTTAAEPVNKGLIIKTGVDPREVRDYKVRVTTTGKAPEPSTGEIRDVNTEYTLMVRHKYGRREDDGLLPLEISVVEGEIVIEGQRFSAESTLFPRLTLLLDRGWQVKSVFGIAGTRYEESRPGLNYSNLIILFFLPGADERREVGETWHSAVRMQCYPETYNFNTTLKSFDTESAQIHQEINWASRGQSVVSRADARCSVDSKFALLHGKLLESRADCKITFLGKSEPSENGTRSSATGTQSSATGTESSTVRQDSVLCRANVRIDISLVQ